MNRLIWVKDTRGYVLLLNPLQVVCAQLIMHDNKPALRLSMADLNVHAVTDPDGRLLHILTDGVPHPPEAK